MPHPPDQLQRVEIEGALHGLREDMSEVKEAIKKLAQVSETQVAHSVEIKALLQTQQQMDSRLNNHGERIRDLEMRMPENLGKRLGSLEQVAPETRKKNGLIDDIIKTVIQALVMGLLILLGLNGLNAKKAVVHTAAPVTTQQEGQ